MMTPDLQMTTAQFFGRAGRPPMEYGLNHAFDLLAEVQRLLPKGPRPPYLSIVDGKLTLTVFHAGVERPFYLDANDLLRTGIDVAHDIVQMLRREAR